jgi:hypothetical protein
MRSTYCSLNVFVLYIERFYIYFSIPKVMAAFIIQIQFANTTTKAVSRKLSVIYSKVDSNCPSKSPVRFSNRDSSNVKFPFSLMVEFNFPLIIPASGASF